MRLISALPEKGRVLEIGCGTGDLLLDMIKLGFTGVGVESSQAARNEAVARTRRVSDRVSIVADLEQVDEWFDLLVACEVLEHTEDDRAALTEWVGKLSPGGRLILSVPAHKRRWGPSDLWAGHFRRYERRELGRLVADVGIHVQVLWCYGFPLANMGEPLRHFLHARPLKTQAHLSFEQRTARSGIERSRLETVLALMTMPLILLFCWIQVPFLDTDFGNGLIVLGQRPQP
jgi:SAM-dependent methyltransferase